MKIVIIGGGKVGYYLCKALLENDHRVSLIEIDKDVCAHIADELNIPVVCGDGTAIETLQMAEADRADVLAAVTGKDEANLIACQLAKVRFSVRKTIARANNPKNVEAMRTLGVDIPVSSTGAITKLIEQEMDTTGIRFLSNIQDQGAIIETAIPPGALIIGKPLRKITLPKDSLVVSVLRDGQLIVPRGDTVIQAGDLLLSVSTNKSRKALFKTLVATK